MKLRRLEAFESGLLSKALSEELQALIADLTSQAGAGRKRTPCPRPEPSLDLGAFLLWSLAGLRLFHREGLPPLQLVADESRRVIVRVARQRHGGNITYMAKALGTSRRALRESMKRLGLYRPSQPLSDDPSAVMTSNEHEPQGQLSGEPSCKPCREDGLATRIEQEPGDGGRA